MAAEVDYFDADLAALDVSEEDCKAIIQIHVEKPHLSAYECRRELKIQRNKAVLHGLGLLEEKPWKPPPKPVQVKRKWTPAKPKIHEEPTRRSKRIAGGEPVNYSFENLGSWFGGEEGAGNVRKSARLDRGSVDDYSPPPRQKKQTSLKIAEIADVASDSLAPIYDSMKSYKVESEKENTKPAITTEDVLKKVQELQKGTLVRVCKTRISALAIHPTTEKLLVAGGSKRGEIGLAALPEGDEKPITVRLEADRDIMAGCRFTSNRLYTSSYTGVCRVLDPVTTTLNQVLALDGEGFRGLDVRGDTDLYLTGMVSGQVMRVDTRSSGISGRYPAVADGSIYGSLWTVNCHPLAEHYFVTGSNNHTVTLWDDRKTKKPLYVCTDAHYKTVSSASFDPVTGNALVTVGYDDIICRLKFEDHTKLTKEVSIRHLNETGRWLTKFQAEWYPSSSEVFAVGSMARPRRIDLFDEKLTMIHKKEHEDLILSVQSLIRFHPVTGSMASGNSSGYVTLWQ